ARPNGTTLTTTYESTRSNQPPNPRPRTRPKPPTTATDSAKSEWKPKARSCTIPRPAAPDASPTRPTTRPRPKRTSRTSWTPWPLPPPLNAWNAPPAEDAATRTTAGATDDAHRRPHLLADLQLPHPPQRPVPGHRARERRPRAHPHHRRPRPHRLQTRRRQHLRGEPAQPAPHQRAPAQLLRRLRGISHRRGHRHLRRDRAGSGPTGHGRGKAGRDRPRHRAGHRVQRAQSARPCPAQDALRDPEGEDQDCHQFRGTHGHRRQLPPVGLGSARHQTSRLAPTPRPQPPSSPQRGQRLHQLRQRHRLRPHADRYPPDPTAQRYRVSAQHHGTPAPLPFTGPRRTLQTALRRTDPAAHGGPQPVETLPLPQRLQPGHAQ